MLVARDGDTLARIAQEIGDAADHAVADVGDEGAVAGGIAWWAARRTLA